jgi:GT2 family glycosyltransferase
LYLQKAAVVILNYNGVAYLRLFLPSVVAYSFGAEVIVADNASTDDSIKFVREFFPSVRVIELKNNLGYAGGYNEALKLVNAEYFVLLNSDVEVTEGWLDSLINLMDSHQTVAACQPKIRSYSQRTHFEYAGASGGWIDRFGFPFARGRIVDTCEADNGQYDDVQKVFWATGACLLVRSHLYLQAGGLDPFFFAHMEEIDLCWRFQRSGFDILCCPQSTVYHVGGGTLPRGNTRKLYLNFRNNLILLAKNLPFIEKCWVIPLRMCLDVSYAFGLLIQGNPGDALSILKAHAGFLTWCVKTSYKDRLPLKRTAGLPGFYTGLLPWQYFIRRKTKFSEIIKNSLDNS